MDIVFITGYTGGNVTALYNNGSLMWNYLDSDMQARSYPIIGDPDGDGIKNILYSKFDNSSPHCLSVMILNGITGASQWTQDYLCDASLGAYPGDSLTLADIDGDGIIEIIYSADDVEEPPY